jgi:hypothetical protein
MPPQGHIKLDLREPIDLEPLNWNGWLSELKAKPINALQSNAP